MHVMIIKQPRKPAKAMVVEKHNIQHAKDIQSTMQVMNPKWKCELLEATKLSASDAIPVPVVRQVVTYGPLYPADEEEGDVLKALEALL